MNFGKYLMEQADRHPSVQPQDIVKMCYQAACGAEHLLSDLKGARRYLEEEYAAAEARDAELYENISDSVCRIDLSAWKYTGMPMEWLFRISVASAGVRNQEGLFDQYLKEAGQAAEEGRLPFDAADWKRCLEEYGNLRRPVHHSPRYREAERPAYRLADRRYIRLLPVLEKAAQLSVPGQPCVIAIDGRAASGKSTMAQMLSRILDASVIRMDDFFLPPDLRTPSRYAQPGGNVHYERFREEVLPYISVPECFSYRIFNCGKMDYDGNCQVESIQFRIVEGSYSCHPLFGRYASLTVCLDVEPQEQMRRISLRNGEAIAEMFRKKWIPLEEAYFEKYRIGEEADICFS